MTSRRKTRRERVPSDNHAKTSRTTKGPPAAPAHPAEKLLAKSLFLASTAGVGLLITIPWLSSLPLGWLAIPAFIGFAALLNNATPRAAFKRGWAVGFFIHLFGSYWLASVLTKFAGYHPSISWVLILILYAFDALRYGIVGWLVARLRGTLSGILLLPLIWTTLEFLWPALFPWRAGQMLLDWPAFVQFAEFTGAYGPTFLLIWGSAVLFALIARQKNAQYHAAGLVVALTACIAFGIWRISNVEKQLAARPPIKVGLVQPGGMGVSHVESSMELTAKLPPDVQLVVWPESAIASYSMAFRDFGSPEALEAEDSYLTNPFAPGPRYYLAGGTSVQIEPPAYYNTAFLVGPDHKILDRYHKRTLIPFGEYIPGESWFPSLRRFSPWDVAFFAGQSDAPLVVPGIANLGVCICYEDVLAGRVRDSVRAGADLIVNLTNDAWFGRSPALMQHQRLAAFRTIENRRYLLRCTATGSTAIISPIGKTIAQAPILEATALVADVHPCDIRTFYTRFGDIFAWLCVIGVLACVIRRWKTRPLLPEKPDSAR